jgi:hypothetical protein
MGVPNYSSNSACSICRTTNPQLVDKSTTNPQHLEMSRCCGFVVDSTTNPQQMGTVEYGFRLVQNKSKSCTTNPLQIHNESTTLRQVVQLVYHKSTTNPQQIEQVEFELTYLGMTQCVMTKLIDIPERHIACKLRD